MRNLSQDPISVESSGSESGGSLVVARRVSAERPAAEWSRRAATRVLLAEDDDDLRECLADILREDGYDVAEARNGVELLDTLAMQLERPIDPVAVVVSDLRMPELTGMQVLGRLHRAGWKTPFILMSASCGEDCAAQAMRLGAVAVLHKPFRIDDLRAEIARWAAIAAHPALGLSGGSAADACPGVLRRDEVDTDRQAARHA